jgi:hypothetical protein
LIPESPAFRHGEYVNSLINRGLKTIDKLEHYCDAIIKTPTCGLCKNFNKTYQQCTSGQQIADYYEEYGVSESFECNIPYEFDEIENESGYLPIEDEKKATKLFESKCKTLPINLMDL